MSDIIYTLPPIPMDSVQTFSNLSSIRSDYVGWQIKSWMADKIHSEFGIQGEGIKVGVADTGVSRYHLTGDLEGVADYKTFVGDRDPFDRNSHGSHCLSIVGGKSNGAGMIGYAPKCEMYSAKVLSNRGSGGDAGIAEGILWLHEQGCSIISLSLGSPNRSSRIMNAISHVESNGCVVFAAAGNDGNNSIDYPAAGQGTIPVGAIDNNLRLANFSDRGIPLKERGIVAGGVSIYGCFASGWGRMSGTSMATPGAAGQLALLQSAEKKFYGEIRTKSLELFLDQVNKFYVDLGVSGDDTAYGNGAFDCYNAIKHIVNDNTEPEPPVEPPTDVEWKTVYTDENQQFRLQVKED